MRRLSISAIGALAVPAAIRGAAVLLSLGAVLLSYRVLPAKEFTDLNLILFCVAAGTSLAAPINRNFWLQDPEGAFAPSAAATLALVWTTILVGYVGPNVIGSHRFGALLLLIPAILYVFAKNSERFLYGRTLALGSMNRALLITLAFSFSEISSLVIMYFLKLESVGFRLLIPAIIFVAIIGLARLWPLAVQPLQRLKTPRAVISDLYRLTLRAPGPSVLLLTGTMTAAVMIDRPLIAYGHIFDVQFGADYLLALSYAIALQTVLTILFDVARRHIFFQNEWQPHAGTYAIVILGSLLGVGLIAIVVHPILVMLHIIPPSISWVVWSAMVLRSITLLCGYICFVDLFQKGKTASSISIAAFILTSVFLIFLLVKRGMGLESLSAMGSLAYISIILYSVFRLMISVIRAGRSCAVAISDNTENKDGPAGAGLLIK